MKITKRCINEGCMSYSNTQVNNCIDYKNIDLCDECEFKNQSSEEGEIKMKIICPKEYKEVKHHITGEIVRIHGEGVYTWSYIGKRGTGYKGRGKQISTIGYTQDRRWYNIATGEIK
jgi:hypothetical protein